MTISNLMKDYENENKSNLDQLQDFPLCPTNLNEEIVLNDSTAEANHSIFDEAANLVIFFGSNFITKNIKFLV